MSSEHIDVRYIADLARIDLSDQECETFQGQLESIIGYIEKLKDVDVEGIEPTAHASPVFDRLREDGFGSQPPVAYRALDFLVANGLAHKIERLNAFVACGHPSGECAPAFLICRGCEKVAEAQAIPNDGALGASAMAVGFMNFAGCCPFLFKLWAVGGSMGDAVSIIANPMTIIVMYGAAAVGYIIHWAVSLLVSSLLHQRGKSRQKMILKRQKIILSR